MRYRAVAIPSEESNAVGTLELECTPHGLFVAYLGVGAFSEGYAPGALATGTGLTVPWGAVTQARLEGEKVLLALDPKLTPLNRLALMHFATGRSLPPEELAKRRLLVRLVAVSAALVTALLLGVSILRSSPETSAGVAIGLAGLAAALLLGVGFVMDRNLGVRTDDEEAVAGFVMELGHYLPTLIRLPKPPRPEKPLPNLSELSALLPRTTLAIVITLTAGTLGVLLVARWVSNNHAAVDQVTERVLEPRSPENIRAPAAIIPAPSPAPLQSAAPSASLPNQSGATLGDACRCARADSTLWAEPPPRLSVLVLSQRVRLGKNPDENKRKKYLELDVAAVNNSNKEFEEVALLVLFYDRDPPPSNKRSQISNRSLFFEGPLLPGQAIKWSVEAEGTDFEIQNPFTGNIGLNGEDSAPSNRIAELLQARNRPVRLHGAMLLGFLGDPRAKEGVLGLREALREDEAPYLTRLIQALSEVQVCQLELGRSGKKPSGRACVYNRSKETKSDLGIRIRGLERAVSMDNPLSEPPTVLVENSIKLPGELAQDSGRSVRFDFDLGDKSPMAYEAHADRYDLLR